MMCITISTKSYFSINSHIVPKSEKPLTILNHELFQIMCNLEFVIHQGTLCQRFPRDKKIDCWWFSEHIVEKGASWEGKSSWTHTTFGNSQLTMLFSCGGDDNHIHWNPPHKKRHAVKCVSGSTGCQQHILLLLCQIFLPFFRLPSCHPHDLSICLICVFCIDLWGLIISLRITHASQSFKLKFATNPSDVISYPNPKQSGSIACCFPGSVSAD